MYSFLNLCLAIKHLIAANCTTMANSILVLDEVQMLPTGFLRPIVDALKAYQEMFGVSVLFTTASQPVLSGLIEGTNPKLILRE